MNATKTKPSALDAFMAKKAEIDAALARLQALSADHFNTAPDEVNWANVGSLGHCADKLAEITEFLGAK